MRLASDTRRDAGELAEILNDADKPQGFPVTDNRRRKWDKEPAHRRIVKAHAISLALALILDQLEAGEITTYDLLKRSAMLVETNPTKAAFSKAAHDEKIERNRLDRLDNT